MASQSSSSLGAGKTAHSRPPFCSTRAQAAIQSASGQSESLRESARVVSGLTSPAPCAVYGGLVTTSCTVSCPMTAPASRQSAQCTRIRSSRPLSATLLRAISATSGCTSNASNVVPSARALSSSGRTPVPVPMSQTRSPRFAAAKSASSTASVPKRKPFSRWMIRRPPRCKSSMRSPGFNSALTVLQSARSTAGQTARCADRPPAGG